MVFRLLHGNPVMRSDEAWFLWAMHRVTHGDVLYRDVYFVTTPLSAWLGSFVVALGGTSLTVVRLLSVGLFIASVCFAWSIAARSHVGIVGRVLLVAGLFVYASPVAHFASIYSALAILCALAAMWCALRWLDVRDRASGGRGGSAAGSWWLVGAGVAAGSSIASKPNTGALALLALIVTVVAAHRGVRAAVRDVGRVLLPAGLVSLAMLVPVVVTGAFSSFVSDVLLEKGDYIRVMSSSPVPGLSQAFSLLDGTAHATRLHPRAVELGSQIYDTFALAPLVVMAVLAWAVWRSRGRTGGRVTLGVAFSSAGMLAALPTFGPQHAAEVMPLALTAMASAAGWAARQPPRRSPIGARAVMVAALAVWLAVGVVAIVARSFDGLDGSIGSPSTLPAVGSSPVLASEVRTTEQDVVRLRRLTHGRVFILRADAAYYYLVGHLTDPTPFDFPVRSDFGSAGEGGVIADVRSHRIPYVCVGRYERRASGRGPDFRPLALDRAVRRTMHFTARLRLCDLYSAHVPAQASGQTLSLLPGSTHRALGLPARTGRANTLVRGWSRERDRRR